MYEMDADAVVHTYLGNKPVTDIEHIRYAIQLIRQQYIDNSIGRWAVIEKSSNNFIGWAGLKLIKDDDSAPLPYYDLGYRLLRKYWGQGFATEAALAIVNYGFEKMNLQEICARAETGNSGSINVLRKAGLKIRGTKEYDSMPHYWLSTSRQQWAACNCLIIEKTALETADKEAIFRLWNNEYPWQLAYAGIEAVDYYLQQLTGQYHYLAVDKQNVIIGWAFTFERDGERWFAIIIEEAAQKNKLGTRLLGELKKKEIALSGWVTDHDRYSRLNGEPYHSPISFYLKNGFSISSHNRLETSKLSAVKIKWKAKIAGA